MNKTRLIDTIKKFSGQRVLVIGDIMLDKYLVGSANRISEEAPVPIVHVKKEELILGGASNAAHNLTALGARTAIAGIIGNDDAGTHILGLLNKKGIDGGFILIDPARPTTLKTRIFVHNHQLIRFDYEQTQDINDEISKRFLEKITDAAGQYDALFISDYAKGVCRSELITSLISLFRSQKKPIIVDSKNKKYHMYKGATLLTPNHNDASRMTGILESDEESIRLMGERLVKDLQANILITRGEKGMSLLSLKGEYHHVKTKAKEVFDVTGAGDTVASVISLALAAGASLEDAAVIATHAASIVIMRHGNATCTQNELIKSIEEDSTG